MTYAHAEPKIESADEVLLLTPSCGLGGGIERYAETLESVFATSGIGVRRFDLHDGSRDSRILGHIRMMAKCRDYLRGRQMPVRIIVMHSALLLTVATSIRSNSVAGVSLICHGNELWGPRSRARRCVEEYLMRRPKMRTVPVSTYTAGALPNVFSATILPPGLSPAWFSTLVSAGSMVKPALGVKIVTAFRLAQWREKGLPQLLDAVTATGRPDISVTVCGSGEVSEDLYRLIKGYEFCSLRVNLAPLELARQYAEADLFVLATQPRFGRYPFCETFGLVLLEAQVAGTPVVVPAYGGSRDVFVQNRTGLVPANESAGALAEVLSELLDSPDRIVEMGAFASEWARGAFDPKIYASRALAALL